MKNEILIMKNLITSSVLILFLFGFTPIEPDIRPNPPEDPCWYVEHIPCELYA
jgi:hypothetical protein